MAEALGFKKEGSNEKWKAKNDRLGVKLGCNRCSRGTKRKHQPSTALVNQYDVLETTHTHTCIQTNTTNHMHTLADIRNFPSSWNI